MNRYVGVLAIMETGNSNRNPQGLLLWGCCWYCA